jgi:hypothetical protein
MLYLRSKDFNHSEQVMGTDGWMDIQFLPTKRKSPKFKVLNIYIKSSDFTENIYR